MVDPEAQGTGLNVEELKLKPEGPALVVIGGLTEQIRILRTKKRMSSETMPKYGQSLKELEAMRAAQAVRIGIIDQLAEPPPGYENWRTCIEEEAMARFAAELPKS